MMLEIFRKKELNLTRKNDDEEIMNLISQYRSMYPDIHEYCHRLKDKSTRVSTSAIKIRWILYVNIMGMSSKKLSSRMFKKIKIIELRALQNNVISAGN